jgi:hypothetical protein
MLAPLTVICRDGTQAKLQKWTLCSKMHGLSIVISSFGTLVMLYPWTLFFGTVPPLISQNAGIARKFKVFRVLMGFSMIILPAYHPNQLNHRSVPQRSH